MSKVPYFHSSRVGTRVYHNNGSCTVGNNIEKKHRKSGNGNRLLCSHCARLNKKGL